VVVLTEAPLAEAIKVDEYCHAHGIAFIKVLKAMGAPLGALRWLHRSWFWQRGPALQRPAAARWEALRAKKQIAQWPNAEAADSLAK
jgi:hypothetical protein